MNPQTKEGFIETIRAHGLTPPANIEPGRFVRFPGSGKGVDNRAGWAHMFPDGRGGCFGDWSTGNTLLTWQADHDHAMSNEEAEIFRQQVAKAQRKAEEERQARQTAASAKAEKIWQKAEPAKEDHPYLIKKSVKPHGLRQTKDGKLLLPLRDGKGKLHPLQFIDADGYKRFLADGRTVGRYLAFGKPDPSGAVCICEGFATGASIHEVTGYPVAVAFNAGNLKAVAEAVREKLPDAYLIICADDDAATEGNPGLSKARETAEVVGGLLAVPDFGKNRPTGVTDFNDLMLLRGNEAMKNCIEAAKPVEEPQGAFPTPKSSDKETIQRLAALSPLEYDRIRKSEAKALGVRPATLDAMVKETRKEKTDTCTYLEDVSPWPEPIDPAELLDDISAAVRQFIVCS